MDHVASFFGEGGREPGRDLGHGLEDVSSDEEARGTRSFGVLFGAPNGERPLPRAAVENEKLLTRKLLAEYAARDSNPEPTDEEFMSAGFGESPLSCIKAPQGRTRRDEAESHGEACPTPAVPRLVGVLKDEPRFLH